MIGNTDKIRLKPVSAFGNVLILKIIATGWGTADTKDDILDLHIPIYIIDASKILHVLASPVK